MDSSENNFNQMPSIKTLQAFEQTARFGNGDKGVEAGQVHGRRLLEVAQ